jgi:hypothetical protein
MKIWQTFNFKAPRPHLFAHAYTHLKPYMHEAWRSTCDMFARIHEFHPSAYVTLVIGNKKLECSLIQGDRIVESRSLSIHDFSLSALNDFLNQTDGAPINLITNTHDVDFKPLELNSVRFWDRFALLKQFGHTSFPDADWVASYVSPTAEDPHRRIFLGIRPNTFTGDVIQWLSKRANTVCRIQHMALPLLQGILGEAPTAPEPFHPWKIIVREFDNDSWQMIVAHHDGIMLCRQGYLNQDSLLETDLAKEVATTLKFIQRFGYESHMPLSCIFVNMNKLIDLPSGYTLQVTDLKKDISPAWVKLPTYPLFAWIKQWACPPRLNTTTFAPRTLLSHLAAYRTTRLLASLCVPLVYFCLIGSGVLWLKNQRSSSTIQTLDHVLKEQIARFPDINHRVLSAKIFDYSLSQTKEGQDPIPLLRTLASALTPWAVATDVRWHKDKGARSLYVQLHIDSAAFTEKTPKRGKKAVHTFDDFKLKVESAIKTQEAQSACEWTPIQNTKDQWNLKVTLP